MRGIQVTFVVAFVRPVIGLTIGDKEGPRTVFLDRIKRGAGYEGVDRFALPECVTAARRFIENGRNLEPFSPCRNLESTPDRQLGPRRVQGPSQDIPIDYRCDFPRESAVPMQILEDVRVSIENLVIALDCGIDDARE